MPACEPRPHPKVLAAEQGSLESITSDARGRLFYTDSAQSRNGRLLRLDRPGARPKLLKTGIFEPGGLAFEPGGALVMGYGNAAAQGLADNGQAGLVRVDPETGASRAFVSGLGMANGVVRGRDGNFYASNAVGDDIDRVVNGNVQPDWAKVQTPNGLVIDSSGRYLYAAQTFKPASIARVDLAAPAHVTTYFSAPTMDAFAGLDGMTRDAANRLFVAANAAGEVWRVGTDRKACALAKGLTQPSAVAFGGGGAGFGSRNLYVVTFSGEVIELANATDSAGPTADTTDPVLSGLRLRPARFLAARVGASAAAHRGTRVSYRLSEIARVRFTVQRARPGRRVGGRCVAPRRWNRNRPSCRRYFTLRGSFSRLGRPGLNSLRFRGRLAGRRLTPGLYRLVAVPRDGAGNVGRARRARFRILTAQRPRAPRFTG